METNTEKVKIVLDGRECRVDKGLTVLEATRQNGIHIPTLCHHPAVSAWGGCRMCVVEIDGSPRLAASCVTPVRDGMEVVTSNERITESRRLILEFLFSERNHNCMFCSQSGECELQDMAYDLQMDHLSVFSSFDEFPVDITNEYMGLDHNRCILCGRCVRACAEITGAHVLDFTSRGPNTLIGFDLNETRENSTCFKCGVCMEVCPTGAIYNRLRTHSAVTGHSKEAWESIDSVCPLCGLLCPTTSTVCDNTLLTVESSALGDVSRADRGQLCRRGRFEVLESPGERVFDPMIKDDAGRWAKTDWENALGHVAEILNHMRDTHGGGSIFGLVSSMCANENLMLFRDLMTRAWSAGYVDTFDGNCWRNILNARDKTALQIREMSVDSISEADFILVIGEHAFESHPVVPAIINKKVLDKEAEVAVVGSGDFHMPQINYRLPVGEEDIEATVRAMLKKVLTLIRPAVSSLELKKFQAAGRQIDSAEILEEQGLDQKELGDFDEIARNFAKAASPLVLIGARSNGIQGAPGLKDAIRLAFARNTGSGRLPLIIFKPFGNSAGAWKLGAASPVPPPAHAGWKAGLVMAANGETPGRMVADNFDMLEFLAVFSPFFPKGALGKKANVILPVPLWMEEDGSYTSMDGREVIFKKRVLDAPANVKDSRKAMIALAEKAGVPLEHHDLNELQEKTRVLIIEE
ncbi:MAG: (2Fe-2S)-binding protein [Desulfobacteraceae bacterium]|nr:(2Fe-2S)-binding protein [Desulfobacteraceae bacterium]